ncbi:hypothetical protein AURDEDRAFT_152720 [Auricularia subglabra TFB-10046 SS5]|nr:hypothetical protein AURDEDRAFT_152720 [Auricularia subglabra TFB-10046 SS5]
MEARRALALTAAFFFVLFVGNVLLHAPQANELLTTVSVFRPHAAAPAAEPEPEEEERVVLVLVMFGLASAREGQHMLKSALMRSSRPLDVHIVCSPDAVPFLHARLDLVTRPARDVFVQFYPITPDKIATRAQRAGVSSKHHAGLGGLVKIFLHELLPPSVPRALYVDTDAFFASDPYLLWQTLLRLAPTTLLAFPRAGHAHANGALICSCVMAMNLAAMRAAPLMPSSLLPGSDEQALGNAQTWAASSLDAHEPPWGDQGLLWAMWRRFPDRFERLSRSWDVSACRGFYRVTLAGDQDNSKEQEASLQTLGDASEDDEPTDAVEGMIFPGIVHFNCQEGEESVFENAALRARPEWGPMLAAVAQFKWVWLNVQPPPGDNVRLRPRMRTHVVPEEEVRFLDEMLADGSIVER